MNKQFSVLLTQAVVETESAGITDYKNLEAAVFQRYAELVVRECAQIAEDVDGNSNTKRCVLEYFGVERSK